MSFLQNEAGKRYTTAILWFIIGIILVYSSLRQSGYSVMAILRMLRQFDIGETERLRQALDTPGEEEAIETIADRWLTTLAAQENRAQAIIRQIAVLIDIVG
jgi:hypothetical protein